jgi:hypothetical protein
LKIGPGVSNRPEKRDRDAIRAFAYDLGLMLKKHCRLH